MFRSLRAEHYAVLLMSLGGLLSSGVGSLGYLLLANRVMFAANVTSIALTLIAAARKNRR